MPALRRIALSVPLLVALALPAPAQQPPLKVLATVAMIGDLAARVAGDCAEVDTLLGPGVDPHTYAARPGDVRKLAAAEMILYVDVALEERLAEVFERVRDRATVLGVLTAAHPRDTLRGDGEGRVDPHLWMDVGRWADIAPVIARAITEARPGCADAIAANRDALMAELRALDRWVQAAYASIPPEQRLLVTAHDAFHYLSDAYGITASEAIEGISAASEASIGDIRAVARFVAERGVPAVFTETTISPRTMEALVAEVRSMGHTVEIGGTLYSDAMGPDGTPEGTYIGMIRANTRAIATALGGTLPPWPDALAGWAARHDVPVRR